MNNTPENESDYGLCYEYRTYDSTNDVVTFNLTYDRKKAFLHDQFAIPLYVQSVEIPENSKGILLHLAIRGLQAVDTFFKLQDDDLPFGKNTHLVINQTLTRIIKQLRKGALVFGNRHEEKMGSGTLHVNKTPK